MCPAVDLQTLGTLDVLDARGERVAVLAGQQKRLALLVYLAVESVAGPVERDLVSAVFWPERPNDRARGNLRSVLHFLRGALPADAILVIGDERLQVNSAVVACDAAEALRQGRRRTHGVFLEGVHLRGAGVDFYDWVDRIRAKIERLPVEVEPARTASNEPSPARRDEGVDPRIPDARDSNARRQRVPADTARRWGVPVVGMLAVTTSALIWNSRTVPVADDPPETNEIAAVDRARRVLLMPFLPDGNPRVPEEIMDPGSYWIDRRIGASGVAGVVNYATLQPRLGDPSQVDLLEAADSAYADYVVVGRVRTVGDSVIVEPRIVRADDFGTETPLPPESAPLDAPLAAFDRAAERVLAALAADLSPTWRWPVHSPPPTLEIMRLEKEAHDAFYETDYDRFHVLADSARALDEEYVSYPMLNLKASAYWNQRTVDPLNFQKTDSTLAYMESRMDLWSPGQRRGLQWMRSIVSGDPVSEFEAVSSPTIAEASDRGPYRLAMSSRRTNRLHLALALIDKRFLMHPRATRYRAWDQVHLSTLARLRDFRTMLEVVEVARIREPDYGLYSRRAVQAWAGLGEVDSVYAVVDRSRAQPFSAAFNPASHLVEAATVALAEGWGDEALTLAERALLEISRLDDDAGDTRWTAAQAHVVLEEWGTAAALLEDIVAAPAPIETRLGRLGLYGASLAASGRTAEAQAVIDTLDRVAQEYERFYVAGLARWHSARIHTRLGDPNSAVRLLTAALESGMEHAEWAVWDIPLLPLRDHPSYRDLVRIRS